MRTQISDKDGVLIIRAENDRIAFEIAPQLGGRIISVYNKDLEKEFLWHNQQLSLAENKPGADYDACFWGGIDELLPNDIPETIDSITYPDHGELWTTQLGHQIVGNEVIVEGTLPLSGLYYQKILSLPVDRPFIETRYRIRNDSGETRHFLWKLHAAVRIKEGDRMVSRAKTGRIVDAASSRFKQEGEFAWPDIEDTDASIVPAKDGTMDFFYLYDNPEAVMQMQSADEKTVFTYHYDPQIFPYQWYFASYGQFRNHYTAILEPASAMPVSLTEAKALGQCTVLEPGEEINTLVTIYAGPDLTRQTADNP